MLIRLRKHLLLTTLMTIPGVAQVPSTELDSLACRFAGETGTNLEKAERLLDSLGRSFKWLATDYQRRTPVQIVRRGGGNCFELAVLYGDLIRRLGVKHRQVAEINLHVYTPSRQRTAEQKVKEAGPRMSVFGERHNDHRWVEIYDERTGDWIPADPSMGVIGLPRWVEVRLGFGARMTIDTAITNDMIAPFAIFVVDSNYSYSESRTEYYVVESFNDFYQGQLAKQKEWKSWVEGVKRLEQPAREAFQGKADLHKHTQDIAELNRIYDELRKYHAVR